jgi:hypothetical protein
MQVQFTERRQRKQIRQKDKCKKEKRKKKPKKHVNAVARCQKQMKEQQKQNIISTNVREKPSSIPEPPCTCQVSRRQTKEGKQKDKLMCTDVNNIREAYLRPLPTNGASLSSAQPSFLPLARTDSASISQFLARGLDAPSIEDDCPLWSESVPIGLTGFESPEPAESAELREEDGLGLDVNWAARCFSLGAKKKPPSRKLPGGDFRLKDPLPTCPPDAKAESGELSQGEKRLGCTGDLPSGLPPWMRGELLRSWGTLRLRRGGGFETWVLLYEAIEARLFCS